MGFAMLLGVNLDLSFNFDADSDPDPNWKKARSKVCQKSISRDTVSRFFASGFFHESFCPMPLKITLGTYQTFRNFVDIYAIHGTPPVSTTPMLNLPLVQLVLLTDNGINTRLLKP
jgi:hypothetical protein